MTEEELTIQPADQQTHDSLVPENVIQGPEGDNDPATQQWREENWEHDGAKAHIMAKTGDEDRTEAAEKRKQADEMEIPADRRDDVRASMEAMGIPTEKIDIPEKDHVAESMRQESYYIDRIAAVKEKWAGILHDHPVSDEYKASHPEISFTPEGLQMAEEHQAFLVEAAERAKKEVEKLEAVDSFGTQELPEMIVQLYDEGSFEEDDLEELPNETIKLIHLLSNPSTTIGDLRAFSERTAKEKLDEWSDKAKKQNAVLEDVSAGRTT